MTARAYLESLYNRLFAEGYTCLNAFQYVNVSMVRPCATRKRYVCMQQSWLAWACLQSMMNTQPVAGAGHG